MENIIVAGIMALAVVVAYSVGESSGRKRSEVFFFSKFKELFDNTHNIVENMNSVLDEVYLPREKKAEIRSIWKLEKFEEVIKRSLNQIKK